MNQLANAVIAALHREGSDSFMGIDVRPWKDRDPAAQAQWLSDLEELVTEWWNLSPSKVKKNRLGLQIDVSLPSGRRLSVLVKGQPARGFTVDVNGTVKRFGPDAHLYRDVMLWVDSVYRLSVR